MNDFHFEVDAHIDHIRTEVDKIWKEYGVDVIDFDEFDSGDKGNDEQQLNNINIRLKQIRRAYKGRCNIRGVEARRALKVLKCDKHKFRENCFGTLKGKCGTKEVIASPTRESDSSSTSNDKGIAGK
ncbi:hypothetical protein Tco_1117676 [Tanacetum coccineum]